MKTNSNIKTLSLLSVAIGSLLWTLPLASQEIAVAILPSESLLHHQAAVAPEATPSPESSVSDNTIPVKFEIFNGATGAVLPGARVSVIGHMATVLTGDEGTATLRVPAADIAVRV